MKWSQLETTSSFQVVARFEIYKIASHLFDALSVYNLHQYSWSCERRKACVIVDVGCAHGVYVGVIGKRLLRRSITKPTRWHRTNTAWTGEQTRVMYDDLGKRQASIVAQLRAGMTPMKEYLHNTKVTGISLCDYDEAAEPREHLVLRYAR